MATPWTPIEGFERRNTNVNFFTSDLFTPFHLDGVRYDAKEVALQADRYIDFPQTDYVILG